MADFETVPEQNNPKKENSKLEPEFVGPYSDVEHTHAQLEAERRYKNKSRKFWEKFLTLKKVRKEDLVRRYGDELEDYIAEETVGDKEKESEAIARWHILHSPATLGITHGYSMDIKAFIEVRDLWVEATEGGLSAEAINNWPEIQNQARKGIEWKVQSYPYKFEDFIRERDQWVEAGVISLEDANQLPEVQRAAQNEVKGKAQGYPYKLEHLEMAIKKWVEAGVVDETTARTWTEVKA